MHFAECAARLPQSGYLAHFAPILQKKTKLPEIFYRKRAIIAAAEFRGAFYMETFFSRAADFLNGIVSPVKDAVYLALLFAPLAAAGIAAIACACNKKLRARSKNWFLYLSCAFCPFAAAFGVLSYGGAALYAAALALAMFAPCLAAYGALCLFGRQKRAKISKKKRRALSDIGEEEVLPDDEKQDAKGEMLPESGDMKANKVPFGAFGGAQKPRLVRCFGEPDAQTQAHPIKDVRLDYVLSVAQRLKDMPLGAGDRLEAEKMEELLRIYRDKGTLTPAEGETLNDILAALLKMMAKYDV